MALIVNILKQLDHFDLRTSFSCPAGELTALVGPSGAGKSTLIRLIAGLETPDQGTISLHGRVWTDTENKRIVPTFKRKIGLVFQDYTLFPHMTVHQNIDFGASNPDKVDTLMCAFGIQHQKDKRPNTISGGERQRAAFCQALAREPDVLLLDEPFSALDIETRSFLCELLADLKKELTIPIVHVTHDLEEAARLGDKVIAVEKGRITPEWFSRQQLQKQRTPLLQPSYS